MKSVLKSNMTEKCYNKILLERSVELDFELIEIRKKHDKAHSSMPSGIRYHYCILIELFLSLNTYNNGIYDFRSIIPLI